MRGILSGVAVLLLAAALGYGGVRLVELVVYAPGAAAVELAAEDQEIAWIAPATNTEAWERLVEAMRRLCKEWSAKDGVSQSPTPQPQVSRLRVTLVDAFPEQTAGVPQVGLYVEGNEDAKLWVRWYKLSSSMDQEGWVKKLQARGRPPLAILGGDTSDRALTMGRILEAGREGWRGPAPLFLITTATADRYYPQDIHYLDLTQPKWPKLMDVYPGQSFRFCFTNAHMARAVLDFLQENPEVWESCNSQPGLVAGAVATGNPWGSLGVLAAAGHLQAHFLYAVAWSDDRYSVDLQDRFLSVFVEQFHGGDVISANKHRLQNYIPHGVGDSFQANPREEHAVAAFLADSQQFRDQHQLLVLPANAQRARRFLRALCRRAPLDVRNLVVATGDSISFNAIYRDRDVAWNVLDLPAPLVLFAHRNPVSETAGFGEKLGDTGRTNTTSTQDLLLYRDIIEALAQAARGENAWLADSAQVRERLLEMRWYKGRVRNARVFPEAAQARRLFDDEGSRAARTGEHVVWLQPRFKDGRVTPLADITVWRIDASVTETTVWRRVALLANVAYNAGAGNPMHGGN